MVCDRCIMVVRQQLEALHCQVDAIRLGEVEFHPDPSKENLMRIHDNLKAIGFELLEDKRLRLIERIKVLIIDKIAKMNLPKDMNFSDYLSAELDLDYHHLSHTFSEVEGITIEKYIISIKVEKVKELIRYGDLTISEIAWKMDYSSIQALSNQFKKVTGMTPSLYRTNFDNAKK